MYRFKNILFSPLSEHGNPAAIRRVGELAAGNGATLTLLGVVAEPSRLQRLLQNSAMLDEAVEAERSRLDKALGRWVEHAPPGALTRVGVGDPALRVIEEVLGEGQDLVVVTNDDDRGGRAAVRQLLRKCPCPVWVIRPTRARTQRVLAAVNPDPSEAELNRTILELATSMVDLHGGELHVLHAWELYGEATMRSSAFMHVPPAALDELLDEERAKHSAALDELVASSSVPETACQVHLTKGEAAEVITAAVAQHRINLLVMGTVARTGVNAMVMGNTAERVLDEVSCSVIAVKPEDFVSPIRPRAE
ncbi:MAG: universal stress protein [Acidimicrobiales bacterium]